MTATTGVVVRCRWRPEDLQLLNHPLCTTSQHPLAAWPRPAIPTEICGPAAHALPGYPPWLPCSCSEGRQPISSCCWCGFARGGEVTRTRLGGHHPLVHGPSGKPSAPSRFSPDYIGCRRTNKKGRRGDSRKKFIDFYRRTVATRCGRGKGATQGPPWLRGSSLPFDINFARRRPHLAPDHFRDPLYDAQMWALRFVPRCGRRVRPHVAQDRQNFGTDGVADPDRVEVAHEHVYRRQRRP